MLYIMGKEIDTQASQTLYAPEMTAETLEADWEISGGNWRAEDGWFIGVCRKDGGGLIYSKAQYPGDILLDFRAKTIPPCNNDLNFTWKTSGWDYKHDDAIDGYIAGLNGWWENKVGIERYPDWSPMTASPLFPMKSGQVYHIQAGDIAGHCFVCVDGKLVIEMKDPNYTTLPNNRVGLGTYCSQVAFTDLKIKQISWKPRTLRYIANF